MIKYVQFRLTHFIGKRFEVSVTKLVIKSRNKWLKIEILRLKS